MPLSANSPALEPGENPLVSNSLLRELGTSMQSLRALRNSKVRGEEAIRASALLSLHPGDLVCDLSGSNAGRFLALPSAPLWLDPPGNTPVQSILLLLGAAHALAAQSRQRVIADTANVGAALLLVLIPPAGVSRSGWRLTLGLAAFNALPLLLVTLPKNSSRQGELSDHSQGFGVPGIPVDSTDAVALCRVLSESALRARNGDGPTLIETVQWQLGARPDDPLTKHRQLLRKRGLLPAGAPATQTSNRRPRHNSASQVR